MYPNRHPIKIVTKDPDLAPRAEMVQRMIETDPDYLEAYRMVQKLNSLVQGLEQMCDVKLTLLIGDDVIDFQKPNTEQDKQQ